MPRTALTTLLIATLSALSPLALGASSFTATQVQDIQQITKNYLLANPDILMTMQENLQAKAQKKRASAMDRLVSDAPTVVNAHFDAFFKDPNSPRAGAIKPSMYLVEFFDYRCGHCRSMTPTIERAMKQWPRLTVIYKDLPIFGGDSQTAALAALAANKQGKYLPFHNALMNASMPLNRAKIMQVARSVGLNTDQLSKDMKHPALQKQLDANMALAKALVESKVGYLFTPFIVISTANKAYVNLIPGGATSSRLNEVLRKTQWQNDHTQSILSGRKH